MLEKLTLVNFQCHQETEIELDPYCTTIVGRSDVGKSSIIRGLRWLCSNKPGGEAFIRRMGDVGSIQTTQVHLEFEPAGNTVKRIKGNGENSYSLNGSRYTAFGTGVPDEVANLLNVGEVNFQGQHDPPFWFGLTPGQVSKELNAVVNLDLIDRTLSAAASEVRQAKATVNVSENRLIEARERRDRLKWVKQATADFAMIDEKHNQLSKDCEKRSRLATLLETASQLASDYQDATEAHSRLSEVVSLGEKAAAIQEKISRLSELINSISDREQQLCDLRTQATDAENVLREATKDQCPLCGRQG